MNAGLRIETAARPKWREAIGQRELPIFFLLAFLLSWYPWFLASAQGRTSGPNPLGPFVAAIIVAGIAEGWPAIRDLLGRIVRGRSGLRWYGVIFGLPVAIGALALAIMAAFGQVAQMLFHATANTVGAGLIFPLCKGNDFVAFWYLYALLWLLSAVVIFAAKSNRSKIGPAGQ